MEPEPEGTPSIHQTLERVFDICRDPPEPASEDEHPSVTPPSPTDSDINPERTPTPVEDVTARLAAKDPNAPQPPVPAQAPPIQPFAFTPDQMAQLSAMFATAFQAAGVGQQPPPPPKIPTPKDMNINPPEPFNGKNNYTCFKRQCRQYIQAGPTLFDTEAKKIAFVVSYLVGGEAE